MFSHLFSNLYLVLIVIPFALFAAAFVSYGLSKEDKAEIEKLLLEKEKSLMLEQGKTPQSQS